jgi:hypothetical protein
LENKITGRESQGACRQDELIGGDSDSENTRLVRFLLTYNVKTKNNLADP